MTFNLKLRGSYRIVVTEKPIDVASTLRIPLPFNLRVGQSLTRNGWTATRVQ